MSGQRSFSELGRRQNNFVKLQGGWERRDVSNRVNIDGLGLFSLERRKLRDDLLKVKNIVSHGESR